MKTKAEKLKSRLVQAAMKMEMVSGTEEEAEKQFTCYGCPQEPSCAYAWDLYNTGGDCLADK